MAAFMLEKKSSSIAGKKSHRLKFSRYLENANECNLDLKFDLILECDSQRYRFSAAKRWLRGKQSGSTGSRTPKPDNPMQKMFDNIWLDSTK